MSNVYYFSGYTQPSNNRVIQSVTTQPVGNVLFTLEVRNEIFMGVYGDTCQMQARPALRFSGDIAITQFDLIQPPVTSGSDLILGFDGVGALVLKQAENRSIVVIQDVHGPANMELLRLTCPPNDRIATPLIEVGHHCIYTYMDMENTPKKMKLRKEQDVNFLFVPYKASETGSYVGLVLTLISPVNAVNECSLSGMMVLSQHAVDVYDEQFVRDVVSEAMLSSGYVTR